MWFVLGTPVYISVAETAFSACRFDLYENGTFTVFHYSGQKPWLSSKKVPRSVLRASNIVGLRASAG